VSRGPEHDARQRWAFAELLKCRPPSAVTSELADREGLSRRQARRYVAAAYTQLVEDLEDIDLDRKQMVAQVIHGLQQVMADGLASNQLAAVIGAARTLDGLVCLGHRSPSPPPQPWTRPESWGPPRPDR